MGIKVKDFKTGPALDREEAERLAAIMRDPSWSYFTDYLTRIRAAAFKKHMRLDQGPETSGYYKGVYNLADDIINLPEELGKQIFTETKQQGEPHEIENL